jgi:hypothetical protein
MKGFLAAASIDLTDIGYKGDIYKLSGHCRNCGWNGTVWQMKGLHAPNLPLTCPECGCRKVAVGHAKDRAWL